MKRRLGYIILAFIIVGGVYWRAQIIRKSQQGRVVSMYTEWEQHGKPVDIEKVKRGSVSVKTKISAIQVSPNQLVANIPPDIYRHINPNQTYTVESKGEMISGHVARGSNRPNVYTGLHKVLLKSDTPLKTNKGSILVLHVKTGTRRNVLFIPQMALLYDQAQPYVWVVEDNKAKRRNIELGWVNDSRVEIKKGLKRGETVVINGTRLLNDGDRLRIPQPNAEDAT
jgi:hypothetical protein